MAKLIVRATSVVLSVTLFIFIGCGGDFPATVHAQPPADPNARFYGKYLFVGHGNSPDGHHPFYEHGWAVADGAGHWILHSMSSNEDTGFHSIAGLGTYVLNSTGAGTESQQNNNAGSCATIPPPDQVPPIQCADHAAIFISSDGKFGSIVAMEDNSTWEVTLTLDPESVPARGFLASCKLQTGSIVGCDDLWTQPVGFN